MALNKLHQNYTYFDVIYSRPYIFNIFIQSINYIKSRGIVINEPNKKLALSKRNFEGLVLNKLHQKVNQKEKQIVSFQKLV